MARVIAVNISEKKGVRKKAVESVVLRADHGIVGDAHAGSWHRQISLLAEESIDKVRPVIPSLTPGAFAENINTRGLVLYELPVGTKMRIGSALVEVSQIGKQCHNDGCAIKRMVGDCIMPREGIFVVVREGGVVKAGDEITVLEEREG
jgi:MOSC domain-containing protein YiiM